MNYPKERKTKKIFLERCKIRKEDLEERVNI
jgi:hypothetical protein